MYLAASGFSEAGYRIAMDELTRAGCRVFLASEAISVCTGSDGLKVKNDMNIANIIPSNFSAAVFLGGTGIALSAKHEGVRSMIGKFKRYHGVIGAVCYAPLLLAHARILDHVSVTCHPDVRLQVQQSGALTVDSAVVRSGNFITGRDESAGTEFILRVIHALHHS